MAVRKSAIKEFTEHAKNYKYNYDLT